MSTEVFKESDVAAAQGLCESYLQLRTELSRAIVGQDEVVEQLIVALFAGGHAILEGVPGLAKTLLISSIAKCFTLDFARIQFTPDLMPSDITGTEVIQEDKLTGTRAFKFLEGPIFANVILADEINRTPPKTQAALLEAMQERQVSVGGRRHEMKHPFFVLATQNPVEQEGTYPLPEAQQDRFMFKILVRYPKYEDELEVIRRTTSDLPTAIASVLSAAQILQLQQLVRRIPAAEHVLEYALRLVRATRVEEENVPDFVAKNVSWGAGPRAGQFLVLGAKAHAILHGRYHVSTDDIAAVAKPVLRHRIVTNFNADADGMTSDRLVERLLETIPPKTTKLTPAAEKLLKS